MEYEKKLVSSKILFSAIEELLAEGRQAAFTVTGMSMWPFLCHGRDQVIVEACRPDMLRKGDIILLQTQMEGYLLHRITKITENGGETTGDGNCFRDGEFPPSCIRARVVRLIRKGVNVDADSRKWKVLSRLWMSLYPIRRWLLGGWPHICKWLKGKKRK